MMNRVSWQRRGQQLRATLWCCMSVLVAGPAMAQVLSTAFSYQGELRVQGQPANGSFDLQFTPYPNPTSMAPLQAALIVENVAISGGIFSTSLDFGSTLFLGDAIHLQIGVRPGNSSGAFQALSPRQLVQAAPYALKVRAGSVTDLELAAGSVGNSALAIESVTMGKIAPGAVGFEQLAGNSVSSFHIADGSVTAADLAPGAIPPPTLQDGQVTTPKLADTAVTTAKLALGAVSGDRLADLAVSEAKLANSAVSTNKLANQSVTSSKLANGAVTTAALAAGAVGAAQVNPAQIQLRIAAQCESGLSLRGIGLDGNAICNGIDRVADATGSVGWRPAIAIRSNGRALIVHTDQSANAVRLVECKDRLCADAEATDLLAGAQVGAPSAVAVRPDGIALFALAKGDGGVLFGPGLYALTCTSVSCEDATFSGLALDAMDTGPTYVGIGMRANGLALIAYNNPGDGDLMLIDCSDTACGAGVQRTLVSNGNVGRHIDIAMRPDDRAVISHHDAASGDLLVYVCANSACTAGTSRTLASAGFVGTHTSLAIRDNGNPVIAYYDSTLAAVRVADCTTADCSSVTLRTLENHADLSGLALALRADGRPALAFGGGNAALRYVVCGSASCASGNLGTTLQSGFDLGFRGIALTHRATPDGLPVMALHDASSNDLRVLVCADPNCESAP